MSDWDGNVNSPHTMQDEYELRERLGASALTTDDDGQMIPAEEAATFGQFGRCDTCGAGCDQQGCTLNRSHEVARDPVEVTGPEVIAAIAEATNLPAIVEQTGGGCATIYVGYPDDVGFYPLVIGPGWFTGPWTVEAARFDLRDLYVGPDDEGASMPTVVTTLGSLTDAVREALR